MSSLIRCMHPILKLPYTYDDEEEILGFMGEFEFLSNFYRTNIRYNNKIFKSSEHLYMYQKSDDPTYKSAIVSAASPRLAKSMGRSCKLVPGWDSKVRYTAMLFALQMKFKNPELKRRLLNTKSAYLEETNTWNDQHWGRCHGVGHNHLGRLLMIVRFSLNPTI